MCHKKTHFLLSFSSYTWHLSDLTRDSGDDFIQLCHCLFEGSCLRLLSTRRRFTDSTVVKIEPIREKDD
jgi:hypothetical protein